jgi:hypothetical protein
MDGKFCPTGTACKQESCRRWNHERGDCNENVKTEALVNISAVLTDLKDLLDVGNAKVRVI